METAVVKYAMDRFTARCLAPTVAQERIRTASCREVERVAEMRPYVLPHPVQLEMVFGDSSMAAAASRIPGVVRSGDRHITYAAADAQVAYDVCSIALVLAGTVARRERLRRARVRAP